jgi:hypothetical protein
MRKISVQLLKNAKVAFKQQARFISTLEGLSAAELTAVLLNSTYSGIDYKKTEIYTKS